MFKMACVMAAVAAIGVLIIPSGAHAAPVPIMGISGWNQDVVLDKQNGTISSPLDALGYGIYEDGLQLGGTTYTNGITSSLTSAHVNDVTGGHTTFQFQPFNANNDLRLATSTGALTLATAGNGTAYSSLAILATGTNAGPTTTGLLTITFDLGGSTGNSAPIVFRAFNWRVANNTTGLTPTTYGVFSSPIDRVRDGLPSGPVAPSGSDLAGFDFFETDIDLTNLLIGSIRASQLPILSISFSDPYDNENAPGVESASIFAVSGVASAQPLPEPASFGILVVTGIAILGRRRWRLP